jgi:salicylate hydroxylase
MGIEDCAVLSELLSHESITQQQDLNIVLSVFDKVRRERGQWLVQSSQHIGNCYEWIAKGVEDNFEKIEHEINTRNGIIANVNVRELCDQARGLLKDRLALSANSTNGVS